MFSASFEVYKIYLGWPTAKRSYDPWTVIQRGRINWPPWRARSSSCSSPDWWQLSSFRCTPATRMYVSASGIAASLALADLVLMSLPFAVVPMDPSLDYPYSPAYTSEECSQPGAAAVRQ